MNIILIATECFPFAKATSLGDLVSVLAKDLEKEGHNVKIFIPRYGFIDPSVSYIERIPLEFKVNLNDLNISSSTFKGILPNSLTSVFFIESQSHFSNSKEIYLNSSLQNETQNRNLFFCLAVLEVISRLKLNVDIIHMFNPACAQIAKLVHSRNMEYSFLKKSKLIFTIQDLEDNKSNIMAANEAISYSDFITTVSKTFENELLSDIYSSGIAESLTKKREIFKGISSGVDNEEYNPETDKDIAQTYSKNYFSIGKRKGKEDLFDLFDLLALEKDIQLPLFGIVTRLTKNKGLDILIDMIPEIADLNLQFVLLGEGEKEIEEKLIRVSKNYKNIKVCIGYQNNLAKKIYAGSDFFICPGEKHPDGSYVLAAMKYGSIPIAFNSGAIKEIITDTDSSEEANGIVFNNYTREDLFESIIRAMKYYKNKEKWTKFVKQTMSYDTSKLDPAKSYINCYEAAINAKKSQELPLSISSLGK